MFAGVRSPRDVRLCVAFCLQNYTMFLFKKHLYLPYNFNIKSIIPCRD